jgi:hypothetical protein
MRATWIRPLFIIAGAYDLILGVVFLLFFKAIYAWYGIELPNHDGYVQWGAAVVAIFGLGFLLVAAAPERNRDLILLGILFKLAYAATVLGHWFFASVPPMWVPWAFADLVFAALFIAALSQLPRSAPAATG